MRIVNRSGIPIDRALWGRMASMLGLDGDIPAAVSDKHGVYRSKQIQVVVSRVAEPGEDGAYSCGRIEISACDRCTSGFLFRAFLHELVHAWFDSYRRDAYFSPSVESIADEFAETVFRLAGGAPGRSCSSYDLPGDALLRLTSDLSRDRMAAAIALLESTDTA